MNKFDAFFACDDTYPGVKATRGQATTSGDQVLAAEGSDLLLTGAPDVEWIDNQIVSITDSGAGGTSKVAHCRVIKRTTTPSQKVLLVPIQTTADSAGVIGLTFKSGATITGRSVLTDVLTLVVDLTDAPPASLSESYTYVFAASGAVTSPQSGRVLVRALSKSLVGDPLGGSGSATIGDAVQHITTAGVSVPPFNFVWWETLTPGQRYEFRILVGPSASTVDTVQVVNPRIWAARVSAMYTATQEAEVTTTSVLGTVAQVCTTGAVIPAGTYLVLASWMQASSHNASGDAVIARFREQTAGSNFYRSDFSPVNTNEYVARGFAGVMTLGASEEIRLNHALAASGSVGLTSKVKQARIAVCAFSSEIIEQMIGRAPSDGTNSSLLASAWNSLLDSDEGASAQSLDAGTWVEFISFCNPAVQRLRPDWNSLSQAESDIRGFARLDDPGTVGTRTHANFFLSRHQRPSGNQKTKLLTRTPAATTSQDWDSVRFAFLCEAPVAAPRYDSPIVLAAELETGVVYKQWVSAGTDKWQLDLPETALVTRVTVNGVDYTEVAAVGSVSSAQKWHWDVDARRVTIQMDTGDSPADLDRTVVLGVPYMVGRSAEELTDDAGVVRPYYAQLQSAPSVGQELVVKSKGCEVATSFGKIELLRSERSFDDLLSRRVIDGMRVRVYRGWRYLTTRIRDTQQILSAVLGRPRLARRFLAVDVHDLSLTMSRPVAKTTLSVYEGTIQRADKLMPVIYGVVRRVPAYRTTNGANPDTYRVTNAHAVKAIGAINSSGTFDAKAYKDGEVASAANTITVTSLDNATFTLANTQPDYGADVLYVDVQGITDTGASSGTALKYWGEIARHLAVTYGGRAASELVEASFRLADRRWRNRRTSAGVRVPLGVALGVYITTETVGEALSAICQAAFGYWGETRAGRLRIGVPDVEAANLLDNGSFEADATVAVPWFAVAGAAIGTPLSTTVKYFGARAAVISNGNDGWVAQRVIFPRPQDYLATGVAALQSGDGSAYRIGVITPEEGLVPQLSEPIEVTSAYWTRANVRATVDVGGAGSGQIVLLPYYSQGRRPSPPTVGLASCRLWLDAAAITGKVTGDAISQWDDQSGGGNHATQATAAKQPTYISDGIAGHPTVRFDGCDDTMATPLSLTAFGITVFVVYRVREFNDLTASSFKRVVSGSNNWLIGPYAGTHKAYVGSFTPTSGAPAVNPFRTVLVTLRQASASSSFVYVNGALAGAGENTTGSQTGPGTVHLGAGGGVVEPGVFDVAEVIVFDRALNANRRTAWEAYLMQKWGIAAATVVTDVLRAVPLGLSVNAAVDDVLAARNVGVEPHAGNATIGDVDLEPEVFFEARVPFNVNLQKPDRASAGIVTEAEARGLLSSYDPDASEGKAVLRASGRLDMAKVGKESAAVSDLLVADGVQSSYGVAAAMAFFFGRQRNRIKLSAMDFTRVPEVGEFLFAESLRGIPRTPSEDPLWMLAAVDDASDPATELTVEATREMDPVGDREAISPTEIPLGAIVVCTASSCPTDFEEVTSQRGLYLIGASVADQTTIQGSATHRHSLDHEHVLPAHQHTAVVSGSAVGQSYTRSYNANAIVTQYEDENRPSRIYGPSTAYTAKFARGPGAGDHGHVTSGSPLTVNPNSGGDVAGVPSLYSHRGSNDVEHINVLLCRRTGKTVSTIPSSIVFGMSSASMPSGWTRHASFYGLALRGADPGNTGYTTRSLTASHTQDDLGAWLTPSSMDDVFIGQRVVVAEGANSYSGIVLATTSTQFLLLPTHATGDSANGTAYTTSATITALSSDVGVTKTLGGGTMPDHLHVRSGANGTGAIDAHEHAIVHEHVGIASGTSYTDANDAEVDHLVDLTAGFVECVISPHYHSLTPEFEAQATDKGAAQGSSPYGGTLTGATQAAPPRFGMALMNNTGGTETIVPVGARLFFDGAACPPGYSHVSNADGRIIAGSASGEGDVVTDGDHTHLATFAAHAFSHNHGGSVAGYTDGATDHVLANSWQPVGSSYVVIGDDYDEHVHEITYSSISTVDPTLPALDPVATAGVATIVSSDAVQASSRLPLSRSLILCQRN